MKSILLLLFLVLLIPLHITAQDQDEAEIIESLLHEFLSAASVNDFEMHNRFWADDLIYTSAAAERIGKSDILNGLSMEDPDPNEPVTNYSGDQIQINQYGEDTAVVAFRLIAEVPRSHEARNVDVMHFYNTGTFVKRNGEWRVVAWHVTQITN
ncbi:MAG: nuclear transport factor 2 family protein [Balneolaceae bacterium]